MKPETKQKSAEIEIALSAVIKGETTNKKIKKTIEKMAEKLAKEIENIKEEAEKKIKKDAKKVENKVKKAIKKAEAQSEKEIKKAEKKAKKKAEKEKEKSKVEIVMKKIITTDAKAPATPAIAKTTIPAKAPVVISAKPAGTAATKKPVDPKGTTKA